MLGNLIWIIIGVVYIGYKLTAEGRPEPLAFVLFFGGIYLSAVLSAVTSTPVIIWVLLFMWILWLCKDKLDKQIEQQDIEQPKVNPYYSRVTHSETNVSDRQRHLKFKAEDELYQILGITKKQLDDFFLQWFVSDKNNGAKTSGSTHISIYMRDYLSYYIISKEKLKFNYYDQSPLFYNHFKTYESDYKYFETFLDKHCVENRVEFHEWGRPERPVTFPLPEDVEKYKQEVVNGL